VWKHAFLIAIWGQVVSTLNYRKYICTLPLNITNIYGHYDCDEETIQYTTVSHLFMSPSTAAVLHRRPASALPPCDSCPQEHNIF
jgi:hypothetical protein